jgi:hypothetical protein
MIMDIVEMEKFADNGKWILFDPKPIIQMGDIKGLIYVVMHNKAIFIKLKANSQDYWVAVTQEIPGAYSLTVFKNDKTANLKFELIQPNELEYFIIGVTFVIDGKVEYLK